MNHKRKIVRTYGNVVPPPNASGIEIRGTFDPFQAELLGDIDAFDAGRPPVDVRQFFIDRTKRRKAERERGS